ncbi:hypothetical protein AHAS_Ahas13G0170400 [Arachis hypogaea]
MLRLITLILAAPGRGCGRHGTNPIDDPTRDANAFIAAMNTMAEYRKVAASTTCTRRTTRRICNLYAGGKSLTLVAWSVTLVETGGGRDCVENPDDFKEWKCLKYEGGHRNELMHSLVPLEIRNFPKLVNKSQLIEDCEHKMAASRMS